MHLFPRPARVVAPALLVLMLAGCAPAPASHTSAEASTKAASGAPSTSTGPSSSAGPAAAAVPRCTTADLDVSVSGGDGAAGSRYYELVLKNTSANTCATGGFGGVSLVTGATGAQVGAPATRDTSTSPATLELQPGGSAQARLQESEADNYPSSRCRPAPARGFRVYPPNETHAAFVAAPSTGCGNPKVVLLTLSPYRLVH
jgi:hypothetical protein